MKQPVPFGKYLLFERINVGGMAEIFLARSRGVHGFKRLLAIKKILPTMAEDKEFINMFIDEARIASDLSHASIVQIYELGMYMNDFYIAMEYVHGKDMRYTQERLTRTRTPMPMPLAIFIAYRICEALDYAHNRRDSSGRPMGIIHRDVSPQNIIVSYEGEVKICDFGIAKAANRSQKTQAGVLKGKFGYMSPEQVRGLPLDGRSDLFSVGTLLYEMVTLQRLFLGESDFSTLEKVRNADVVPPSAYNRDIPPELEEIILKALAKEVEDRPQSAGEFADALQIQLVKQGIVSSRDLATFMKDVFTEEYVAEMKMIDYYQNLPDEEVSRQIEESGGLGEESEEDIEGKTQIFSSHQPEDQPPPLRSAAEAKGAKPNQAQLADAKTMIFSGDAKAELADARTMIFTEEAVALEDMPTRGVMERPVLEPPPEQRERTPAERLFLPLVVALGILLGWSTFTTVALLRGRPAPMGSVLEVVSRPAVGVAVELDGTLIGQGTPWTSGRLVPGVHQLKLSKPGFGDVVREVTLTAGSRLVLDVELPAAAVPGKPRASAEQPPKPTPAPAPPPSVLVVESDPPGAEVTLAGKPAGRTPLRTDGLEVGKSYRATIELAGYLPVTRTVKLDAPGEHKLSVQLKRRPAATTRQPRPTPPPRPEPEKPAKFGYLVANTQPWAKVYVDGKYTGRDTPIVPDNKLKLSAGKHQVIFETPAGKRFMFEVVIEPDKTVKLIQKLEE